MKQEDLTSWQPRHTAALFGHADAEKTLLDAWGAGRLPHGWLITGPRGVGKATLAFRFARFLLKNGMKQADEGPSLFGDPAPLPQSLDVAEADPVFQRVANYGHGDLITVERSWDDKQDRWRSEIVVADVRGLIERFGMTAAEGGYRVCVVDAADEMNTNAANALLKILEEPPPNAVLLLVSHAPGTLLPTIRSRCRRLALKPLAAEPMRHALAGLLPDITEAERQALGVIAEGSPGRAALLAGQGGLDLLREWLDLIAGLPRPDVAKLHSLGDKLGRATGAAAFAVLAELFQWWLARLIRASAAGRAGGAGWVEIYPGEASLAAKLATWQAPDRWAEDWDSIGRLLERGESVNLDRKQVLLNIFATLGRAAEGARRA
ncbi:DNA polymerase III subunit delta' [Ferrovibrio sp.]|uniref:DNA polymerase III subunit delta' n=1 Tax=Ferrovibrio sp. TaxID=1917215 RepID=UPI0025C0D0FD|nr:DNA polymerase III subunit delta' [Ferrovibrio sp.]MBX3455858.1 DNA polymerase III subunit delta' [Ferrovibrio sp.]